VESAALTVTTFHASLQKLIGALTLSSSSGSILISLTQIVLTNDFHVPQICVNRYFAQDAGVNVCRWRVCPRDGSRWVCCVDNCIRFHVVLCLIS